MRQPVGRKLPVNYHQEKKRANEGEKEMTKRFTSSKLILSSILALFGFFSISFADDSLPIEVSQVKNHILNSEYLELFDTTHYRVRPPILFCSKTADLKMWL
jgi:hypothetical protein